MSRSVSPTLGQALASQSTSIVVVVLLTIDHDDWESPLYFCSNNSNVTSRSKLFVAYPFDIILPNLDERSPEMRLTITNLDRQIIAAFRELVSPLSVTVELVLASIPDTVEASLPDFFLSSIDYNSVSISGSLTMSSSATEPYPGELMTMTSHPGLF